MYKNCYICGGVVDSDGTLEKHMKWCDYYKLPFIITANKITGGSITSNTTNSSKDFDCSSYITYSSPYEAFIETITTNSTCTYDELKMKIESIYGRQKTREEEKIMNRTEAEALVAKAAEALAQVEKIETLFGKDDDYKDGDIIYAEIKFLDTHTTEPTKAQLRRYTTYQYAFIKANGYWYSSGPRAMGETFTWDRLIAWWSTVYIVKMRNVTKGSFKIKNNQVI